MAKVTLIDLVRKYNESNEYSYVLPNQDVVNIGRGKDNDISIKDSPLSTVVSREHCTIIRDGDNYRIVDRNSRYGTVVNDTPIGSEEFPLKNKDYLYLGKYPLQVEIK